MKMLRLDTTSSGMHISAIQPFVVYVGTFSETTSSTGKNLNSIKVHLLMYGFNCSRIGRLYCTKNSAELHIVRIKSYMTHLYIVWKWVPKDRSFTND